MKHGSIYLSLRMLTIYISKRFVRVKFLFGFYSDYYTPDLCAENGEFFCEICQVKLHYKVLSNNPMTKNKWVYHARIIN